MEDDLQEVPSNTNSDSMIPQKYKAENWDLKQHSISEHCLQSAGTETRRRKDAFLLLKPLIGSCFPLYKGVTTASLVSDVLEFKFQVYCAAS